MASIANRQFLVLALVVTLSGCGVRTVILIVADPETYSVRDQTTPLQARQVAIVNGYSSETTVMIRRVGNSSWETDLRQVTDSSVKIMSRHLAKTGVAVEPQAPRTVTLTVRSVNAHFLNLYAGTNMRVRLEAKFGDGTMAEVIGENRSPASAGRALDGALLFAVTSLLNDVRFVDYMNR